MALPASSLLAENPKFQVTLFRNKPSQLHQWWALPARRRLSPVCFIKMTNAHLGDPSKFKSQLISAKERLLEATPSPVKEFPWREAADILLKRSWVIGQKALKWSLIALFILSSMSDVVFSISRNQELLVPVGLLIGCLMTDFLKETLQELFQAPEVKSLGKGLSIPLVIISCIFVLVKVISGYFTSRPQVLMLHVANGGLLQVLWLCRCLLEESDERNVENFLAGQNASTADAEE